MVIQTNGTDYGTVIITNRTTFDNELPHTGGSGSVPIAATGSGLMFIALMGMLFLGKRKRA